MNSITAGTWLLAFCTLAGSIVGAWLVIRAAGREFHDAVIREVAGMQATIESHDSFFSQIFESAKLQGHNVAELQKVTFELKGIVQTLMRDRGEESRGC